MRRQSLLRKLLIGLIALVMLLTGTAYGIARWYQTKHAHEPFQVGATFIPRYARYYGLDPKETLEAVLTDLGVKRVRLVSYWDDIEQQPGSYNFEELDWQFRMAEEKGAKVSLALGLRQPRWPECHMPQWAKEQTKDEWYPQLKSFIALTVERYKDSPALDSYQLENEFFLTVFGECTDFDRDRLVDEYNLVKQLDPNRPIIVSRSNNALGTPIGQPRPDISAVSIYKRVWDKTITKRYFEYPFPAWFYGFLAGTTELVSGKNTIIHELQTESWLAPGFKMNDPASIPEQDKSLNAERLKQRLEYGHATGMRSMDLWGVENWYWRKTKAGDSSLWDTAKQTIPNLR